MGKTTAAQITRHLLDDITTGRLPIGSLLPTEFELCDQFQASRYTVRAVLQELQTLGLVSRRKNVGTRVEANRPKAVFRPTLASVEDLMQFGAEHLRRVQSVKKVRVDEDIARDIGCATGAQRLRISSIRTHDDQDAAPIAWTDVYIDPTYTDIGALVRKSPDTLISALIESRYGRPIAEIDQEVRASTVSDEHIAQTLRLEPGASVLKIIRRYMDDAGETFEASVTLHPADSFSVSMRLKRS